MNTKIDRIEKIRLSDQVIDKILALVRSNKIKIGDKIQSEKQLAEQFDVGRSTIREAMQALSVMGIVTVRPGRGARLISYPERPVVLPLKWNELKKYSKAEELVETRIALEQGIIKATVKNASKEDLSTLQSALNDMILAKNDRKKYTAADLSFHTCIAKASHNYFLLHFFTQLVPLIVVWLERQIPYLTDNAIQISLERHKQIFKCIKERRIATARALIRKNIEKD